MTPEQITDLRRQKYNATVVRLNRGPPGPDGDARAPGLPPAGRTSPASTASSASASGSRACPAARRSRPSPTRPSLARRSYSISCSVLDDGGALLDVDADGLAGILRRPGAQDGPGRGAGADAAAVHAARGRPPLFGREDHRRLHARPGASPTTRSCSSRQARARRRTITCCGSCCAAATTGRSCRPAACGTARTWPTGPSRKS